MAAFGNDFSLQGVGVDKISVEEEGCRDPVPVEQIKELSRTLLRSPQRSGQGQSLFCQYWFHDQNTRGSLN